MLLSHVAGEAAGLRVPRTGRDPSGALCWLAYGRVFLAHAQPPPGPQKKGSKALDSIAAGLTMLAGAEAAAKLPEIKRFKRKSNSSNKPHSTSWTAVEVGVGTDDVFLFNIANTSTMLVLTWLVCQVRHEPYASMVCTWSCLSPNLAHHQQLFASCTTVSWLSVTNRSLTQSRQHTQCELACLQETASAEPARLAPDMYINRYKNAWPAAIVALKQFIEQQQRKKKAGQAALPAAMPLSKFQWPQSQGKGQKLFSRCGQCLHCIRPQMKKACLHPVARDVEAAENETIKVRVGSVEAVMVPCRCWGCHMLWSAWVWPVLCKG